MTTIDPSILREYDIRGIVDDKLTEQAAYHVGRAYGTIIRRRDGHKTGICYDGRHSSPRLAEELIKGLTDSGCDVENYGLGPTPMSYFALETRDLDGVVVITGSHNPPEYNGIKMALRGEAVYGARIQEIGQLIAQQDFEHGSGQVTPVDIYDDYTSRLAQDYKPDAQGTKLKIAWDAGNGAPGAVLKQLTDKLPGEHIFLFDEVDGDFPNHHPDPAVEENLSDLRKVVKEQQCDFGVAFDGDGDRMGVIDKDDEIIWGDQLTALYAKDILDRVPNAQVIMDVKCSKSVLDLIAEWGGRPELWKTGHSLAKARLRETGAPLAGELSGHIFFKEGFIGHDDGLYCAVRLMNVVHKFGPLHELRKLFLQTFATPEIRFDVEESRKFAIIDDIIAAVRDHPVAGDEVLDIDGVRIATQEGWFLIRASNTQNALSLRVESTSQQGLNNLSARVCGLLEASGVTPPAILLNVAA